MDNSKYVYRFGILSYANGEKYEGFWQNDKCHGSGILFYATNDKYNGEWVNGRKHGPGEIIYVNGDRFRGITLPCLLLPQRLVTQLFMRSAELCITF